MASWDELHACLNSTMVVHCRVSLQCETNALTGTGMYCETDYTLLDSTLGCRVLIGYWSKQSSDSGTRVEKFLTGGQTDLCIAQGWALKTNTRL